MRILHFSDPHVQLRDWRKRSWKELGPLRAVATGELWQGRGRRYDRAAEKLQALGKLALEYDHAICTGDFTQLGTREEMQDARTALEPIASDRARFTALAGNHDRFPLDARPVHFFEELFPEQAASDLPQFLPVRVRLLDGAALLLIDSAVPYSWPKFSRGEIEPRDLEKLAAALGHAEVKSRCALVLTHHSPLRAKGTLDWPFHYLGHANSFMRCARAGNAQAILAGHIHQRFQLEADESRPRILCAGSSTDAEGATGFSLEIDAGKIRQIEPLDFSSSHFAEFIYT